MRSISFTYTGLLIFAILFCQFQIEGKKEHEKKEQEKEKGKDDYNKDDFEDPDPSLSNASQIKKEKKDAKKLARLKKIPVMELVTMASPYIFEGVDWQLTLPDKVYQDHMNCYGEYIKCVRDMVYFNTVCAYHLWLGWLDYDHVCDVELQNCIHLTQKAKISKYGKDMKSSMYYYNGEDYYCYKPL